MSLSRFFTVEYTETRPLPKKWQWIGPASYIGIFLLTIFVAIANVALVGYDTVSAFKNEYNEMEHHWYHAFILGYKPTQICEQVTFSVGQSLFSNVSLFNWRVSESTNASDGPTGSEVYDRHLIYQGETLDRCALIGVAIYIFPGSAISFTATVRCNFTGDITQLVTWHELIHGLYSKQAPADVPATITQFIERTTSQSKPIVLMEAVLKNFYDVGVNRLHNISATIQELVIFSLKMRFCPAYTHSCPGGVPEDIDIFIPSARGLEGDRSFQAVNNTALEYARIIAAAVAIDLGDNRTDNNLFLNETLMNQTLSPELIQVSHRYEYQPPATSDFSPSKISTPFLCTYQRLKTSGSLVISVFAATFTVIAGAWNLRTIIVGYIGRESSIRSGDGSKEGKESDPRHGNDQEVGETETLVPRGSADDD